jgi:hypothetical protein
VIPTHLCTLLDGPPVELEEGTDVLVELPEIEPACVCLCSSGAEPTTVAPNLPSFDHVRDAVFLRAAAVVGDPRVVCPQRNPQEVALGALSVTNIISELLKLVAAVDYAKALVDAADAEMMTRSV